MSYFYILQVASLLYCFLLEAATQIKSGLKKSAGKIKYVIYKGLLPQFHQNIALEFRKCEEGGYDTRQDETFGLKSS